MGGFSTKGQRHAESGSEVEPPPGRCRDLKPRRAFRTLVSASSDGLPRPAVVVHQPHFLPWLGYYHKLLSADAVALLDDVQFRRRYFQNRTLIRSAQGQPVWLTIPVHAHRVTEIRDVRVASRGWAKQARSALHHAYARYPYYSEFTEAISDALREDDWFLVDINERSLRATCELLGVSVDFHRNSQFPREPDRTRRLLTACRQLGAAAYIFGEGGARQCHQFTMLAEQDICLMRQRCDPKFALLSRRAGFTAFNVSIVELIFRIGATGVRRLLERYWRLEEMTHEL